MPTLMNMGRLSHDYYKNPDAIEKVIRYITRTRWYENRRHELIKIGGAGFDVNAPVDVIIYQFLVVQNTFNINSRGGRRLIHEVYSFNDEEFKALNCDFALVDLIARDISAYFFNKGFQILYGIHYEETKRCHIHIMVSSINFLTGKKFVAKSEAFNIRKKYFDEIYKYYVSLVKNNMLGG